MLHTDPSSLFVSWFLSSIQQEFCAICKASSQSTDPGQPGRLLMVRRGICIYCKLAHLDWFFEKTLRDRADIRLVSQMFRPVLVYKTGDITKQLQTICNITYANCQDRRVLTTILATHTSILLGRKSSPRSKQGCKLARFTLTRCPRSRSHLLSLTTWHQVAVF